jgi:hypothetical protein
MLDLIGRNSPEHQALNKLKLDDTNMQLKWNSKFITIKNDLIYYFQIININNLNLNYIILITFIKYFPLHFSQYLIYYLLYC